jgi:hypothetical protein
LLTIKGTDQSGDKKIFPAYIREIYSIIEIFIANPDHDLRKSGSCVALALWAQGWRILICVSPTDKGLATAPWAASIG